MAGSVGLTECGRLQVVSDALVGYEQIVKTTPSIPLSTPKDDDVDAKLSTDPATTRFPWNVFKCLAIIGRPILSTVVYHVVLTE